MWTHHKARYQCGQCCHTAGSSHQICSPGIISFSSAQLMWFDLGVLQRKLSFKILRLAKRFKIKTKYSVFRDIRYYLNSIAIKYKYYCCQFKEQSVINQALKLNRVLKGFHTASWNTITIIFHRISRPSVSSLPWTTWPLWSRPRPSRSWMKSTWRTSYRRLGNGVPLSIDH